MNGIKVNGSMVLLQYITPLHHWFGRDMIRAVNMFLPMLIASFAVSILSIILKMLGIDLLSGPSKPILISIISLALSIYLKKPVWWRYINAGFPLMVSIGLSIDVDQNAFMVLFILTLLVYWGAIFDRVPLYLSSKTTVDRLVSIANYRGAKRIIDIGSGTGTVVFGLSRRLGHCSITGIESAPLTWIVGSIIKRLNRCNNVSWTYGNMWHVNLKDYDIVYAFLSPDPMSRLWKKASSEMSAGTMLISNSFPVNDVHPDSTELINDKRGTVLYCYIPSERTNGNAPRV